MLLERLAIALALIALGLVIYRLYGWYVLRRLVQADLGFEGYALGKPTILYFTDPGCAPCLAVQDPALDQVSSLFGDQLQIIKVQALENRKLTDAWGVLSLPTTFIIDKRGHPRGVNHGVARAPKLVDQLVDAGAIARIDDEPGTIDSFG